MKRKRQGGLRFLARSLLVVVLLGAMLMVLWWMGKAQTWLVSAGIDRMLGGRTEVSGVSLGKRATVASLAVYDTPSEPNDPPLIRLEGLELDCALWPEDNRHLKYVTLKNLALDLAGGDSRHRNYDFLVRFLSAPSSGIAPLPFLPKGISIDAITLRAEMPSWSLDLEGVGTTGTIDALDALEFNLHGSPVLAKWSRPGMGSALKSLAGDAKLLFNRQGGRVRVEGQVNLPGLVSVDASAELTPWSTVPEVTFDVRHLTLQDALWSAAAEDLLPLPVYFDTLRINNSRLGFSWRGGALERFSGQLLATLEGMAVGPAEAPYYTGTLRIAADGGLEDDSGVNVSAVLNDGQLLEAELRGGLNQFEAHLSLADWSREQLRASIPQAYRNVLEYAPHLNALSTVVEAEWSRPDYRITARLMPSIEGAPPPECLLTAQGTLGQRPGGAGTFATHWQGSAVKAHWRLDSSSAFSAEAALEHVDCRAWTKAWFGSEALSDFAAKISGNVTVKSGLGTPLEANLDVSTNGPAYGALKLPSEVSARLHADASLNANSTGIAGAAVTFHAGTSTRMQLKDWQASFAPPQLKGVLAGEIDLAELGGWFSLPALQGAATFTTQLHVDGAMAHLASVSASGATLGYGNLTTPYRMPVKVAAGLRMAFENGTTTGERIEVTLGEDTRLLVKNLSVIAAPKGSEARMRVKELELDTAFAPFVAKGFLDDADGTAKVRAADIAFGRDGFTAAFDGAATAKTLVLSGALAAFLELAASGHFEYVNGLKGEGVITAGKVIAGGAALRDFSAGIQGAGGLVHADSMEATLFGGTMKAKASVNLFADGFPIRLSAAIKNADLAAFTEEFQPPSIKLTGRVDGTASLTYGPGGLEEVNVKLHTTEGLTMNRDAVKQLLLSQYMGSVTAGKTLSKAVEKTIGKEPDRHFDTGLLELRYDGGAIVGVASLQSRLLNLTIDIKADPESLKEALILRQAQRVQFATVENGPGAGVQ